MNTLRERILAALQDEPGQTAVCLANRLGEPMKTVSSTLQHMTVGGQLRREHERRPKPYHYFLVDPKPEVVQAARPQFMEGTYTCPELSTPPVRPGAMDAYRLPSKGF